jgi:tRNA threonylcarbamoyl adenosine modification protein YeaZ
MILSIETATELCGTALVHNGSVLAHRTVTEKNIHSERLMVLVDEVLGEAGFGVKDLDGIAVSIGPGSFTGLRIGLSAAKGLAYAQSLTMIAVPTLDAIADEAARTNGANEGDVICALIDAKREEAYYAFYTCEQGRHMRLTGTYSIAPMSSITAECERLAARKVNVCSPIALALAAERRRDELAIRDYNELEPTYIRDFVTTMPRIANQTAIP